MCCNAVQPQVITYKYMIRVKDIPLIQALPGMILEKDVHNSLGQVLLKTGVALSASTIYNQMKKRIGHIRVQIEDLRSEEELHEERTKVAGRINTLFQNVSQDGTMGALKQMILDYQLEKISS